MQTKINFQIFDISLIKCMTVGLISPSLVATFFFKKNIDGTCECKGKRFTAFKKQK